MKDTILYYPLNLNGILKNFKNLNSAKKIEKPFSYSSDNNNEFLSISELKNLIKQELGE